MRPSPVQVNKFGDSPVKLKPLISHESLRIDFALLSEDSIAHSVTSVTDSLSYEDTPITVKQSLGGGNFSLPDSPFTLGSFSFSSLRSVLFGSQEDQEDTAVAKPETKEHKRAHFWEEKSKYYGKDTMARAKACLECGFALIDAKEYSSAEQKLLEAMHIYERKAKPLAVASTLEHIGIARLQLEQPSLAIEALQESFDLRSEVYEDAKYHVDCISSLNYLGNAYAAAGDRLAAKDCFREVFLTRRAVFGEHPCVAVAAHDLANAYLFLGDATAAKEFFRIALLIYEKNGVSSKNPCVGRLLRDFQALEESTI